jgi:hypothetical protein
MRIHGLLAIVPASGLLLLLVPPQAIQAQARVRPALAVGVEPLLGAEYPTGTPTFDRPFTPGYRVAVGVSVASTASPWSWDLRVSGLWRSFKPDYACIPGGCPSISQGYRAYALEGQARYNFQRKAFVKPYIGGGLGLFATRKTEVVEIPSCTVPICPPSASSRHRSEAQVRPTVLGTVGVHLGRAATGGLFVETTLVQFVGSATVSRLLPVQVGLRW